MKHHRGSTKSGRTTRHTRHDARKSARQRVPQFIPRNVAYLTSCFFPVTVRKTPSKTLSDTPRVTRPKINGHTEGQARNFTGHTPEIYLSHGPNCLSQAQNYLSHVQSYRFLFSPSPPKTSAVTRLTSRRKNNVTWHQTAWKICRTVR